MRALLVLATLGALLAAAGAASAHATYVTDDGKYKIVLGQLGEPVYTYQRSGLDLHIRDNATNAEIAGLAGTLNATWIAPGGQTLPCALKVQHGAVGKYTCTDGWTLTQPGLYKLKLVGKINNTVVNATYANKHEIKSQADIMFPDKGLPTLKELAAHHHEMHDLGEKVKAADARAKLAEEKAKALETRLAELEGKVGAGVASKANAAIPGVNAALALSAIAVVGLAFLRRR